MLDILGKIAVFDDVSAMTSINLSANYVMSGSNRDKENWSAIVLAEKFWHKILVEASVIAEPLTKKYSPIYMENCAFVIMSDHRASVSVRGGLQHVRDNIYATDVSIGGTLYLERGWLRYDLEGAANDQTISDATHWQSTIAGYYSLDGTKMFFG